ncbi:MAG: hypothetical protein JSW71_10400 [Gemmatimonadota bacterium]|nr:MAG: hypothetical protein JSW71_10400 [Gemmatimonadota bacterium]
MALRAGRTGVFRGVVRLLVDVEGNRIALGYAPDIRVAVTPEAITIGGTGLIQNTADLMRLMAVDAHRYHIRPLAPQPAFYDLAMYLLNLRVTLLAGLRNVGAVNARLRIGVGQDLVRRVAGGAYRSDG